MPNQPLRLTVGYEICRTSSELDFAVVTLRVSGGFWIRFTFTM